jgi:hypothetical protein
MANTANATWTTSGPAFTNQVVAFGGRDAAELAYHGYASFTGDGATATVTINFIDGVQTPFFTQANPPVAVAPKSILVGPFNTVATSAIYIESVYAISTTGFTLQLSGNAPAVAIIVPFIVFPYTT